MKLKDSIIIILLFIVAVALGVFAGIKITENNQQNNNDNNQQSNSENKVTVESAKTKYANFVNEYKKSIVPTEFVADLIFSPMGKDSRHISKANLKENGVATFYFEEESNYYNKYPNGMTLEGKYIFLNVMFSGSGGFYHYVLIKEDGTVTVISQFESGVGREEKLQITKNYKDYKNIVSVVDYIHTISFTDDEYMKIREKDKNIDGWVFTDIEGNTY